MQELGYGCATCIGNSGPLEPEISEAIQSEDLSVTAVLSGNRNFEGRISPDVKMNYLASPPLVIAYALAGTMDFDFEKDALGTDADGNEVYLKDIWPDPEEVQKIIDESVDTDMYTKEYGTIFDGDERWQALETPTGSTFEWDDKSTYVRKPPYFEGMTMETTPVEDIKGARVLLKLGDSVTTDHISPAGSFKSDTPAGKYLIENGVERSHGDRTAVTLPRNRLDKGLVCLKNDPQVNLVATGGLVLVVSSRPSPGYGFYQALTATLFGMFKDNLLIKLF